MVLRRIMWALKNNTPYAAERTWVLDKNAMKSWVVVVKGTFDILPNGTTKRAEKQEEPLFSPVYRGEPGKSSILYEADLSAPKQATDIILNGQAYVPGGQPTTKVHVSMQVNNLTKELLIFGNRHWKKGLLSGMSISSPEPFKTMPIVYERAFGGGDTKAKDLSKHRLYRHNTVGVGFATSPDHLDGEPVPNIEYPKKTVSSWKDRPYPAGFGAIASYWSPRLEFSGTYDDQWLKNRFPLLPEDFDERFFQYAPQDQQITGFLKGGEGIKLLNLTPTGSLSFQLPRIGLTFATHFGREIVEHRASLVTVILEPDWPRIIMVWHTSLPCHHKVDRLDFTSIKEKAQVTLGGATHG
jgi:hypothetical protein